MNRGPGLSAEAEIWSLADLPLTSYVTLDELFNLPRLPSCLKLCNFPLSGGEHYHLPLKTGFIVLCNVLHFSKLQHQGKKCEQIQVLKWTLKITTENSNFRRDIIIPNC